MSLKEWRLAMPAIGIQTDKKHIDKLFEQFDLDGGGTLPSYHPHHSSTSTAEAHDQS